MLLVQLKVAGGACADVLRFEVHHGRERFRVFPGQWQGCFWLGIFPARLHSPLLKIASCACDGREEPHQMTNRQ